MFTLKCFYFGVNGHTVYKSFLRYLDILWFEIQFDCPVISSFFNLHYNVYRKMVSRLEIGRNPNDG